MQFRNLFLRLDWTWTCHCHQNCSFYPLTQWRLKKRFHKGKTSNHHYFILKTCDNKDNTAFFCGRIIKAVFAVNTLNALWDATLSQSPIFSYSQSSNFDNAEDYTSAMFPDSFSSSPWLSCPMSPVLLSPLYKSFLTPYGWDESHPTRLAWKGTGCTTSSPSGGTLEKHWELPAPSSSSPSHLSPCLTSPQSRLPQWSQKVGLM